MNKNTVFDPLFGLQSCPLMYAPRKGGHKRGSRPWGSLQIRTCLSGKTPLETNKQTYLKRGIRQYEGKLTEKSMFSLHRCMIYVGAIIFRG